MAPAVGRWRLTSVAHTCRCSQSGNVLHEFKSGDVIDVVSHIGDDWCVLAAPEALRGAVVRLRPRGGNAPRCWSRVRDTWRLMAGRHECRRRSKSGEVVHTFEQGDLIDVATHAGDDWCVLAAPEPLCGCWVRLRPGPDAPRCWEFVGDDSPKVEPPITQEVAEALERVGLWCRARVPYSQGRWRDGYRTDCSGYLAMFWGIDGRRALTTRHFFKNSFAGADAILEKDPRYRSNRKKFDGFHMCDLISFEELRPGDALYKACPRRGSCGHVMLVACASDGGAIQIYHQTSGGATRDTLTRVDAAGDAAADGYRVALRRGRETRWTARVWALRRRDKGCRRATKPTEASAGSSTDGDGSVDGGEGDGGAVGGLAEFSAESNSPELNAPDACATATSEIFLDSSHDSGDVHASGR